MSEKKELVHQVVNELRDLKEAPLFEPTADIDMVWVLSAPGTLKQLSQDGIYAGVSSDKKVIEYGIEIVRKVTALRLGKDVSYVTKDEVDAIGPLLYYNGEDSATEEHQYPQNQHLIEAAREPDFPIPQSKLVIGHIEAANTPAQVRDVSEYLQRALPTGKVAVVSMIQHSVRVSRYLKHYQHLLPEGVELVNAPVAETGKKVGKTLREVRKIVEYAAKGDLSREPYF